jgi:hypothetical protein
MAALIICHYGSSVTYPTTISFFPQDPLFGSSSPPDGALLHTPRVDLGPAFAGAVYTFFLTGTSTPTPVYQNGTLTTTFPVPTNTVTADLYGRFPAIYLDPAVTYRVVLTSTAIVGGSRTTDGVDPALATTGSSSVAAVGLMANAYGEYTITEGGAGGNAIALIVNVLGQGAAVELEGNQPGTPQLIVNGSATTGAQTATFAATNKPGTTTSAPAGWLPIQCDGVQYYTPIWFDNNFITPPRYTVLGAQFVTAPNITAASFTFNGNGTITLVGSGATAAPAQWATPAQLGTGAGYYISLSSSYLSTYGYPGLAFNIPINTETNIGTGLEINSNGSNPISVLYTISSSITGTPQLGTGTIYLSGGLGVQGGVNYTGASPLVIAGNGTATLNGNTASPWYTPTTAGIGTSFYFLVTQTTGTFTGITPGVWTNIGSGGLTIGGGTASGMYYISTTASTAGLIGSGTISLTGFSGATDTYATAGTFTETIPAGASNVTIECWGASAGGAGGNGSGLIGEGGASGGYSRTTQVLTSANWGQTYSVTIGAAGAGGAAGAHPAGGAGGMSSVATGTKTITTLIDNGGGVSTYAGGSAGGTASGGTITNTTGNSVAPNGVTTGGAGIVGVNGTGTAGGQGGLTTSSNGANGGAGLAIFKYT